MWALFNEESQAHVVPLNDIVDHLLEMECDCDPCVEWIDAATSLPFPKPLVIHNSFDRREVDEPDYVKGKYDG